VSEKNSGMCMIVDRIGRTTYAYDTGGTNTMGRLATISYKAAAADTILESYSYTAAGLTSSKDFAVTRPWGGTNLTAHLTLGYTYDTEGHQLTMTTPARTFNYAYDAMERATGMTDTLGNTYVSGVQYGAANQLLQITYGDEPANFYGGTTDAHLQQPAAVDRHQQPVREHAV
jgi:YD repeat-containing protein